MRRVVRELRYLGEPGQPWAVAGSSPAVTGNDFESNRCEMTLRASPCVRCVRRTWTAESRPSNCPTAATARSRSPAVMS